MYKQPLEEENSLLNDNRESFFKEIKTLLEKAGLEDFLQEPIADAVRSKALFESLAYRLDAFKPLDQNIASIIKDYFLFNLTEKDPVEISLNEQDWLNRKYQILLESIKDWPSTQDMAPFLDTLCSSYSLPLDPSEWTGSYPLFENADYRIDLRKGSISKLSTNATFSSLPSLVTNNPDYLAAFADSDKGKERVEKLSSEILTTYLISEDSKPKGRIEVEGENIRVYRILKDGRTFQALSLTESEKSSPLSTFLGNVLFISSDTPNEAVVLNDEDEICFKIPFKIDPSTKNITFEGIKICQKGQETGLYDIQALSESALKIPALTHFEHPDKIILLSQKGKLSKIALPRYQISFTYRSDALFADNENCKGYKLDLKNPSRDFFQGIVLEPIESSLPKKIILPDLRTFSTKDQEQVANFDFPSDTEPSKFQLLKLFLQVWWTGVMPSIKLPKSFSFAKTPSDTKLSSLRANVYELPAKTNEIAVPKEKELVFSLIEHACYSEDYVLAAKATKQIEFSKAELNHEMVQLVCDFLSKEGDKNTSSIKLQLILKLLQVVGTDRKFANLDEKLRAILVEKTKAYLHKGRKLDQNLLLSDEQFEEIACIVKEIDSTFYDSSLKIFFSENGALLDFDESTGEIKWPLNSDYDHKSAIKEKDGLYDKGRMSLEEAEKKLQSLSSKSLPKVISLSEKKPLLFDDAFLNRFFQSKPFELPKITFPSIDSTVPINEKKAVEKLQKGMEKYAESVADAKVYHFSDSSKEEMLKKELLSLKTRLESEAKNLIEKIQELMEGKGDPDFSLAIRGGMKETLSFHELTLSFMQKDLSLLKAQGKLPSNADCKTLHLLLEEYFEKELNVILLEMALKAIKDPNKAYQILATKRHYSKEEHPELLAYEYLSGQIFRDISRDQNQIEFVSEMLSCSNGVFQAITGSGKTTVLSVLRGLLQANGKNLVTFSVLPTLLKQSFAVLEKNLGKEFGKKIYLLKFDLKQRLVVQERKKGLENEEEIIEHSLFKDLYHELLLMVLSKGTIVTDYKSIPLMQEKWIKLTREFLALRSEGNEIPEIALEHWTYLKKILLLLKEREETLMDEFDVPNKSRNRLQIPIGSQVQIAPFLWQESLCLYEELRQDDRLKLSLDLQRDLPQEVRNGAIQDLAVKKAGGNALLLNYFLGKEEFDFSGLSEEEKDRLVLIKDQLTIFLPETLKMASGLNYERSQDGSSTVFCHDGEPQENSRFGHPLEEINTTIQDYLANGVHLEELKRWIKTLQDESLKSDLPIKQFKGIFQNEPFPEKELAEEELLKLQSELNKDWSKIRYFLEIKLQSLKVSGFVISMTPHDAAAMPKSILALSATVGCLEELPSSFEAKCGEESKVMGEMAYRLIQRTKDSKEPLIYDPENPLGILSQGKFHAIIDGAGAFRLFKPSEVAAHFKEAQSALSYIGYIENKKRVLDSSSADLEEKGFYYSKSISRGHDESLSPKAKALLTIDSLKTLEELAQNDGRMRLEGQTIRLARSCLNPELTNTEDILVQCARSEGRNDAEGLFRSKMQEIPHLVRQAALEKLLSMENIGASIEWFESVQDLFVQSPAYDYAIKGSYHAQNHLLRPVNSLPKDVLETKKTIWLEKAKKLGLDIPSLEALSWDSTLLEKMPLAVASLPDSLALGLQVEQEVEIEMQQQVEAEVEVEKEIEKEVEEGLKSGQLSHYPEWIENPKTYQASTYFHSSIDKRIIFTENFLPVERKDPLFRRRPFDETHAPAHTLRFVINKNADPYTISEVIMEDIIESTLFGPFINNSKVRSAESFSYDLRLRKCTHALSNSFKHALPRIDSRPEYALMNWKKKQFEIDQQKESILPSEVYKLTAQIRFINGECEDYSEEEQEAITKWLKSVEDPKELMEFFQNKVLQKYPNKKASFKHSTLYKLFQPFLKPNLRT